MGCNCGGSQTAMFLPTEGEYVPNLGDMLTTVLLLGGIAGIAFLAVKNAGRITAKSKRPKWVGKTYVRG